MVLDIEKLYGTYFMKVYSYVLNIVKNSFVTKEITQHRVFGELSFAEIALIFSKTESWARVTYHRLRLKIIERMESDE